jgi:hypothetical protein
MEALHDGLQAMVLLSGDKEAHEWDYYANIILVNCQIAKDLVENPKFYKRSKHIIDIMYH